MQEPLIRRSQDEGVVRLCLNSPQTMNALSLAMLGELEAQVDALSGDEAVRCVVVTGEGRAFCAGGDLLGFQADLADPLPDRLLERLRYAQNIFHRIETLPMPVIAAVNGYAIAGGLELLLCCDMVLAAESARIGDGHARYGIIPAGGSSARLPRKIGANRANFMLLSAQLMPATTMEAWGLVNQVVPDDELAQATLQLAHAISQHSPLGLKVIKGLLRESLRTSVEDAARAEITAFAHYAGSKDFAEGLAAFAGKRLPRFTGQ